MPVALAVDPRTQFNLELCEAFLAADIPLEKMNNSKLREFMKKYIDKSHSIPDPRTLRQNYVKPAFDKVGVIYELKLV